MSALFQKVAIVTGASSGIGRAAAKLFAREGAKLVVTARRAHELETLVAEIRDAGGEAIALPGDVTDERHARALVELAVDRFGGLDVAFDNAGASGALGPTSEISLDGWKRTIDTNLTSAFLLAKHQAPALVARGGGSLIFTSTFVGHTVGMPGMAAYAASKAGLIGLVQTLAVELGAQGVRVNALLPGGTDTPAYRAMNASEDAHRFVSGLHALGRVATPDEIARAALWLASDASSFQTGTAMLVDGGISIRRA
ncbi:SDR family oxidoreductase [Sandaracinus amylolyticus]|uniref:3-oxoacyl-[acyl-carrier protein] reductase n=1 Tax=Sandaracinus amylolyticus TaxID=927083 RepID=A0A0F6SED9_9BACT|nr:SDR family oxidoreductase [Sandaracinus amylolyticus]AKF05024.1 3-oxoacyl-[acyl-carrier protein] reductase [Sandaracinus amylolyticus]